MIYLCFLKCTEDENGIRTIFKVITILLQSGYMYWWNDRCIDDWVVELIHNFAEEPILNDYIKKMHLEMQEGVAWICLIGKLGHSF